MFSHLVLHVEEKERTTIGKSEEAAVVVYNGLKPARHLPVHKNLGL